MTKVEILQEEKTFEKDFFDFIIKKSPTFKRDFSIDNILISDGSNLNYLDYLKKGNPIKLENVFGSTYQSSFRSNDNIYAISHTIESIVFENEKFYANLIPSEYGDVIDFEKGALKPVYYKEKDDDFKWSIATFDISFNIIDNAA